MSLDVIPVGKANNMVAKRKTPLNIKELQLMSITAEECGELTQACMKAIRFGMNKKAREKLVEELGDVQCMIDLMIEHGILTEQELDASIDIKYNKLKTWSNLINET